MLNRLKRVLVESYIASIALGYLLAETILHFVNIFAAPLAGFLSRREYGGVVPGITHITGFPYQYALPELIRFIVALLVWYILLRWLFYSPPKTDSSASSQNQAPTAD